MDRELNVYLNLNTDEVVLGNQMNLDDDFKQLAADELISIIDNLYMWDELDQEIYDELFNEYNIDLDDFKDENDFYDIEEVISQVKEYIYGL